jgi:hypothetical protein
MRRPRYGGAAGAVYRAVQTPGRLDPPSAPRVDGPPENAGSTRTGAPEDSRCYFAGAGAGGPHWASARSPSGMPSGVGIAGVSRMYHSASSAD